MSMQDLPRADYLELLVAELRETIAEMESARRWVPDPRVQKLLDVDLQFTHIRPLVDKHAISNPALKRVLKHVRGAVKLLLDPEFETYQ